MAVFTVKEWLHAIENYRLLQRDETDGATIKAIHLRAIDADFCDGMRELRAIAQSEGAMGGVSPAWVRENRGLLVCDGRSADDVDGMTMLDFAGAIAERRLVPAPKLEWSHPMTKAEGAKFHNNGVAVSNPTDYLANLIFKGLITPPIGGGRQWQFNIQDFPERFRDTLR